MDRILIIRGGAIGDFILTLPALKALRDSMPHAHIEILGYKHIAALAENRYYAQAVRSIEYAPLARFFATNSELPAELADYFASFDLIISYLYDPDLIFERNLRRCGIENLICGPAKIVGNAEHAARQLARPIEKLGIKVLDLSQRIFPSVADRQFAREFLGSLVQPFVAIHPGSGSRQKNWPIENWITMMSKGSAFSSTGRSPSFVVISGEADERETEQLEREWRNRNICFARNLPLPHLAGVLANSIFVGHDSGISHLAAAAGANCILLFGPTDPNVWAPRNNNVRVLKASTGSLRDLKLEDVEAVLSDTLHSR
jgi:heptosyltransferase III